MMREWITLITEGESGKTPESLFIATAEQMSNARVEAEQHDDGVLIKWIEGRGDAMGRLCVLADHYGVTLILGVEIYAKNDGGKLVPYYQSKGFVITHMDTGSAFDDEGDFDLARIPDITIGNELFDQVEMKRTPR